MAWPHRRFAGARAAASFVRPLRHVPAAAEDGRGHPVADQVAKVDILELNLARPAYRAADAKNPARA